MLTEDEITAAMLAALDRRELAELTAWAEDLSARATAAVADAVTHPQPGQDVTTLAAMAAEFGTLADVLAAEQAARR